MSIAFVASDSNSGAPVSDAITVSAYAAAAGTDRCLIAISIMQNDSPDRDPANTTIAMGAANFTMFLEEFGMGGNNDTAHAVGYLLDADIPGSATDIVASMDSGNNTAGLYILEFTGVDQTTPIGGTASYQGRPSSGSDQNADLTTAAENSWIINSAGTNSNADTIATDSDPDPDVAFTDAYNQNMSGNEISVAYSGATASGGYNNQAGSITGAGRRSDAIAFELREAVAAAAGLPPNSLALMGLGI